LLIGNFHWGGKYQLYDVLDPLLLHNLISTYFEPRTPSRVGVQG